MFPSLFLKIVNPLPQSKDDQRHLNADQATVAGAGPSLDGAFLNPGPGVSQGTAHPALGTIGNAARERFQSQLPEARRATRPRSQSLSSFPDVQP